MYGLTLGRNLAAWRLDLCQSPSHLILPYFHVYSSKLSSFNNLWYLLSHTLCNEEQYENNMELSLSPVVYADFFDSTKPLQVSENNCSTTNENMKNQETSANINIF